MDLVRIFMDVQKIDHLPGFQDRIGRTVRILLARHIVHIFSSAHIGDPHVINRCISNDRAAVHMVLLIEEDRLRRYIFQCARGQFRETHFLHHIRLQLCMILIVLVIHDAGKINILLYTDLLLRFNSTEPRQNCLCEFSLI